MIERLENIAAKYEELYQKLTSPEILQDFNTLKRISKEQKDLEEIVEYYE